MRTLLERWLPGITLFAWAMILLHFHFSGRVKVLLVPLFRPWVVVAGVVLLVMAAVVLLARRKAGGCCEEMATCGHAATDSLVGRLLTLLILLLPMAAAAAFTPDSFGLTAVKNRGIITNAEGLSRTESALNAALTTAQDRGRASGTPYEPPLPTKDGAPASVEEETFSALEYMPRTEDGHLIAEVIDFLFAAQEADLRRDFEGATVAVVGQLMPEEGSETLGNRFKLLRMFMTCCAADARPVGVSVRADQPPPFDEMTLVQVVGAVSFPEVNGEPTAVIDALEVRKSAPPDESMLF